MRLAEAGASRRIALNSTWLAVGQIASQTMNFVFHVLLARLLGEAGLGQYAFITILVYVGNVFATFGLDTVLMREIASRQNTRTSLLSASLIVQIALSAGYVGLVVPLVALIPGQTTPVPSALVVYSLSLIPLAFLTVYTSALRAFERMDLYLTVTLVTALARLMAIGGLASSGGGLLELCWLLVGTHGLAAAVGGLLCHRYLPDFGLEKLTGMEDVRNALRLGLPLAILMVASTLYQRLGTLALWALADDAATGWYSAAIRIVEAVRLIPASVFGALFPALAAMEYRPLATVVRSDHRGIYHLLVLLAVGSALLLTVLAGPLVMVLFGEQFNPSTPALRVLAWGLVPFVVAGKLSLEGVVSGHERRVTQATVVTLVLAAGLNTILIGRWGLIGAAWAAVIAEILLAAFLWLFLRRMRVE